MSILKFIFYSSCLLSLSSCRTVVVVEDPNQFTLIVGTSTKGDSKGIYTYHFDENSGKSIALSQHSISNPTFMTLSSDNKYLYSVSENDKATSAVVTFAFDSKSGVLDSLSTRATESASPCYILNGDSWIATANYGGGTITTFAFDLKGVVEPIRQQIYFGGDTDPNGDIDANIVSHLHSLQLSPDKRFLFAADLGRDSIYRFAVASKEDIASGGDILTALLPSVSVAKGSGPRHLTFTPSGKHAYLINEMAGSVIAYNYLDGDLVEFQTIQSDSVGGNGSADIHLSPDGKFLYTSNRLKADGISIFSVDEVDGRLTKIGYADTGIHPRNFLISPRGRYLLVACRDSNAIQIYSRDSDTGLLSYMGEDMDIKIDAPMFVKLVD